MIKVKKIVSAHFIILCLLCTVFLMGLAFDIHTVEADGVQVGIKSGDWIKHDYTITDWPPETPYPEWLKIEFLNVEGTNATVRVTMHMSDGTEQNDTVLVDVVAGGQALGLSGLVIPANMTVGESIFMSGYGNVTIVDETTGTYAGANRAVVYAHVSQGGSQLAYFWDRHTGVMVQAWVTSDGMTATALATESNMWEAASRVIYIRADGSIEPSTAPISTIDNMTYTLTDNIVVGDLPFPASAIIVERNNTTVDGAGYTIWGTESEGYSSGISVGAKNVTIKNANIMGFVDGIWMDAFSPFCTVFGNNITKNSGHGVNLFNSSSSSIYGNNIENNSICGISLSFSSSNNIISGNSVANNTRGIYLGGSSHNTICGNNVTDNWQGIDFFESSNNTICGNNVANNTLGISISFSSSDNTFHGNNLMDNDLGMYLSWSSSGNLIYHNNFVDNFSPVHIYYKNFSVNIWDSGYPSGGNYWMNTQNPYGFMHDSDHDGIADTPYIIRSIDGENNTDNYPLMGMFSDFKATPEHHVQTICNSTISAFQSNSTAISFDVTGENGTVGFCRICIPMALMSDAYKVFVNGTEIPHTLLPFSNSTHSYLCFTYNHSTQDVLIIPEFPSILVLSLLMILTLGVAVLSKKKRLYIESR